MFEQTFKNIDDILYKDADSDNELDCIGQTSWVMFCYKAIADAKRELGSVKSIRETFVGFQAYLYREKVG